MKKILSMMLLAAIAFTAGAQKLINDPNAEKRNVSGFHAIEVGGGIDLFLSEGNEAVAVSAAETKFRDRIKTEVVNGVLKIRYDYDKGINMNWNSGKMKLKAYVSYKELDKLLASGGSEVVLEGSLKASKFELGVSGGGDFKGKLDVTELVARVSGGSDVNISGNARSLEVRVSGGSDFDGFDLTVVNCNAEASGGSDISITATGELNVESSGGSDVHYKGSAVIRNVKSSGGGSVKKAS
jgi:hypothetical protein